MLKQTHGEHFTITNNEMHAYSDPKYKNLYEEILKDYHYRWGKFAPIPYPNLTAIPHHEQQRNTKTSK